MPGLGPVLAIGGTVYALWLFGQRTSTPASRSGPVTSNAPGLTGTENASGDCANASGDFAAMVDSNHELLVQMPAWQASSSNPYSWAAFRSFLKSIGAVDPGPNPPILFCSYSPSGV